MSVQPQITRIATSWPGDFLVDDLLVPTNGAADIDMTTVLGTMHQRVTSITYGASNLTFTCIAQTLFPGVTIVPYLELGTSTLVDVGISSLVPASQTFAIQFRTPGGALSSPPAASFLSNLHVALFRPLPR